MPRVIALLFVAVFSLNIYCQDRSALADSILVLQESIDNHPDNIDFRLQKAALNMQLDQWEYAKDEYDYVLTIDKKNAVALYFRAFANTKLGRYKFARADYELLLTIVPDCYEAQIGLALLYDKDKHHTKGLDLLNALCETYPWRAEAFAARAGIEKDRKMLEAAEYDYSIAVELQPNNVDYRLCRVDIRILLHLYDEAQQDLDTLIAQGIPRPALAEFYDRL